MYRETRHFSSILLLCSTLLTTASKNTRRSGAETVVMLDKAQKNMINLTI